MIEEKAKKGVTILVGITISDYHEKLELLLHNGGRIEYIGCAMHADYSIAGGMLFIPG